MSAQSSAAPLPRFARDIRDRSRTPIPPASSCVRPHLLRDFFFFCAYSELRRSRLPFCDFSLSHQVSYTAICLMSNPRDSGLLSKQNNREGSHPCCLNGLHAVNLVISAALIGQLISSILNPWSLRLAGEVQVGGALSLFSPESPRKCLDLRFNFPAACY